MRPTTEINVAGKVFLVKTYASARETQAIQQAYFKGVKVGVVGDQPKIDEFNPGVQYEVEKELIAQMVISMGGSTENIVDRCLDLPADEYTELVQALDALVAKKKK